MRSSITIVALSTCWGIPLNRYRQNACWINLLGFFNSDESFYVQGREPNEGVLGDEAFVSSVRLQDSIAIFGITCFPEASDPNMRKQDTTITLFSCYFPLL